MMGYRITLKDATVLAEEYADRTGKPCFVTVHERTGSVIIDGLRADYWLKLRDKEVTEFSGRTLRRVQ